MERQNWLLLITLFTPVPHPSFGARTISTINTLYVELESDIRHIFCRIKQIKSAEGPTYYTVKTMYDLSLQLLFPRCLRERTDERKSRRVQDITPLPTNPRLPHRFTPRRPGLPGWLVSWPSPSACRLQYPPEAAAQGTRIGHK